MSPVTLSRTGLTDDKNDTRLTRFGTRHGLNVRRLARSRSWPLQPYAALRCQPLVWLIILQQDERNMKTGFHICVSAAGSCCELAI